LGSAEKQKVQREVIDWKMSLDFEAGTIYAVNNIAFDATVNRIGGLKLGGCPVIFESYSCSLPKAPCCKENVRFVLSTNRTALYICKICGHEYFHSSETSGTNWIYLSFKDSKRRASVAHLL